jgi:hypothetical protein
MVSPYLEPNSKSPVPVCLKSELHPNCCLHAGITFQLGGPALTKEYFRLSKTL